MNLSISEGRNGNTMFTCHSHGCTFDEIRDAIPAELWDQAPSHILNGRGRSNVTVLADRRKPKATLVKRGDEVAATLGFAHEMWEASKYLPDTSHAYALRKHFTLSAHVREAVMPRDYAVIKKGDRVLVIKMTDEDGCFVGVQLIGEDGAKVFAGNMGMLICSYTEVVGSDTNWHVVEGYATATAVPVMYPEAGNVAVVAFSKNALEKVSELIRARFGDGSSVTVHHEIDNIDLWDVCYDEQKRARYLERVLTPSEVAQ